MQQVSLFTAPRQSPVPTRRISTTMFGGVSGQGRARLWTCCVVIGIGVCAMSGRGNAQEKFTPPSITGFNPASPSIVSPDHGRRNSVSKPTSASRKATRTPARPNQPRPAGLYQPSVTIQNVPPHLAAPMPQPGAFKVPPPVPPASPLASPPPGQSCDPFGPGHCGLKRR